jgi:replication factor C subunit 3/5
MKSLTQVVYWAAFYEDRMVTGSKDIFHLEAFIAKYMALYKEYLVNLFG